MLELTALQNAITRLKHCLEYATDADLSKLKPGLEDALLMGAVHAYRICYDLTIKTLRRYLILYHESSEGVSHWSDRRVVEHIHQLSFLTTGWEEWKEYAQLRNVFNQWPIVSHVPLLLLLVPKYLKEVQFVVHSLGISSTHLTSSTAHGLELPTPDVLKITYILNSFLPSGLQVYVFGSRANGRAHRGSDLDLAIDASRKLTIKEFLQLEEAFHDSDLPYKVDVVDIHAISPEFLAIISSHWLQWPFSPK